MKFRWCCRLYNKRKPEDHWSCIAHLSADDMLIEGYGIPWACYIHHLNVGNRVYLQRHVAFRNPSVELTAGKSYVPCFVHLPVIHSFPVYCLGKDVDFFFHIYFQWDRWSNFCILGIFIPIQ